MAKEFERKKNCLVVNLSGEIDQYAASELKARIDVEIEKNMNRNIIINLSDVTLMDSSGIGLVVGRYKKAISLGGNLVLCSASSTIRRIVELSGITKVIKCYATLSEAEKHFLNNRSERNEQI